ncbi:LOW QUALITY PROTEIN: hypothetical protein KUTeg_000595 [Tegillarca granosa]|uniref:Uncharacterized protein n=1 Tax=Tegillarca granosa TaxID=220873 RepID=A0ABQ9FY47_TEGGR|nr:LOW QUALITY PROTEIN: hypothetical protein KUTeg_000595 [Tegillarca granosa]
MNVTYCKILSSNIQDVLTTKWKHLKTQGKRNRPHWADKLTLEDIESLYKSGNLGTHKDILKFNSARFFYLALGRKEHTGRWGHIQLRKLTTENRHCPVAAYKQYVENTPNGWKDDQEAPFYVACNPKFQELYGDYSWFIKQSIGENKMEITFKKHAAGVTERKVNHSARKTTVTSFLHSNIAPTQIMQIT